MGKIYVENENFKDNLENIGLNVCKDIYIDDDELDKIMDKIIDKMLDSEIVLNLKNIGIYIDITYRLDSTIYKDE